MVLEEPKPEMPS